MNKDDLVTRVAESTGQSKKITEQVVTAALNAIADALAEDDKVTLVGFGTFQVRERAAREGRNPRTGAVVQIEARKSPQFSAGKGLRERVHPAGAKAAAMKGQRKQ